MSATDVIEDFFRAFRGNPTSLWAVRTANTPVDMIVADRESGWIDWRLVPAEASLRKSLEDLLHTTGAELPRSFGDWYLRYHTLAVHLPILSLPANPTNAALAPLRRLLVPEHGDYFVRMARERGLIPFGDEALLGAGPLCFDPSSNRDPERWVVRYWDHEWEGTDAEVGPVVFSSFERLLIASTAFMNTFRMPADGGDRTRENREACLRAVVAADPEGAGGPGRDYWLSELAE